MKFKSLELQFEVFKTENDCFSKEYIAEVKSDDFLNVKKQIQEQVSAISKEVFSFIQVRIMANISLENDLSFLHKQECLAMYRQTYGCMEQDIRFETAFILGNCMKNFNYENLCSVFEGISLKKRCARKEDGLVVVRK